MQARDFVTNGDGRAWQVLDSLRTLRCSEPGAGPHPRTAEWEAGHQQQVRAVGARATDQDWEQRLADALTAFRDCRWAPDHLPPAGTSR